MMSRNNELIGNVQEKFMQAKQRFLPDKGNDKDLLDKCTKHLDAYLKKQNIMRFVKENFVVDGTYDLLGKFAEVLQFEEKLGKFFSENLGDSFLVEEVHVSTYFDCFIYSLVNGCSSLTEFTRLSFRMCDAYLRSSLIEPPMKNTSKIFSLQSGNWNRLVGTRKHDLVLSSFLWETVP